MTFSAPHAENVGRRAGPTAGATFRGVSLASIAALAGGDLDIVAIFEAYVALLRAG